MKLTKKEAEHFTRLVEALRTARGNLDAQFSKLDAELQTGCDNYDGEEDREKIGIFQDEIQGLGWIVDKIHECQSRLESFKARFDLAPSPENAEQM